MFGIIIQLENPVLIPYRLVALSLQSSAAVNAYVIASLVACLTGVHVKKQVLFAALVAILQYLVITKTVSISYCCTSGVVVVVVN